MPFQDWSYYYLVHLESGFKRHKFVNKDIHLSDNLMLSVSKNLKKNHVDYFETWIPVQCLQHRSWQKFTSGTTKIEMWHALVYAAEGTICPHKLQLNMHSKIVRIFSLQWLSLTEVRKLLWRFDSSKRRNFVSRDFFLSANICCTLQQGSFAVWGVIHSISF